MHNFLNVLSKVSVNCSIFKNLILYVRQQRACQNWCPEQMSIHMLPNYIVYFETRFIVDQRLFIYLFIYFQIYLGNSLERVNASSQVTLKCTGHYSWRSMSFHFTLPKSCIQQASVWQTPLVTYIRTYMVTHSQFCFHICRMCWYYMGFYWICLTNWTVMKLT